MISKTQNFLIDHMDHIYFFEFLFEGLAVGVGFGAIGSSISSIFKVFNVFEKNYFLNFRKNYRR